MPLTRPTVNGDTSPPPPFTVDRADVTGMTAGDAHEAILGAFDAAVIAAAAARGMVDQAVIDAKVAELADARKRCLAHPPAFRPGEGYTFCYAGGENTPWPCPIYREAAEVIADGLPS